MTEHESVALLIIDDLGIRKLPAAAAEDLLELIMRRHKRSSTIMTSNRPVDDWGKLLGDTPAVSAMLDRLLHHGHVLKCGPKSWRTKSHHSLQEEVSKSYTTFVSTPDSPTKNISEDENPELVRRVYAEIYRLARGHNGRRLQFLLIDSDLISPNFDLPGFSERRMAGEPDAPSLIPYYRGP